MVSNKNINIRCVYGYSSKFNCGYPNHNLDSFLYCIVLIIIFILYIYDNNDYYSYNLNYLYSRLLHILIVFI